MKELFPIEVIENSQEKNFSKHSTTSKVLYVFIVMILMIFMILLPFIKVDVGVRGHGIVRPVTEIVEVRSPASGHIQRWYAEENKSIRQGEIFALLDAPDLTEQLRYNRAQQAQLKSHIHDLELLNQADSSTFGTPLPLTSPLYHQSYRNVQQQLFNQKLRVKRQRDIYERSRYLHARDAGSLLDIEKAKTAWDDALFQYHLMIEQQQLVWENDRNTLQKELKQLKSEYTRLKQQKDHMKIRSPVSGTLQNVNRLYQNHFIHHNQVLAEISPDTTLVAEIYISPDNIGLLRREMPVRIQIDTYNQNHWGTVSGVITSISGDVQIRGGEPFYKVTSSLDQSYLTLPNGVKGEIKKGMTLSARFIINRRSLMQLLYDKIDDWLNPSWNAHGYPAGNKK